jgi:hypothetical protein
VVFVSSLQMDGNIPAAAAAAFPGVCSGTLAGLQAADCICNQLAAASTIPRVSSAAGSYLAFLSDATTSASSRLTFAGPYLTPNGVVTTVDLPELITLQANLLSPIDRDENNNALPVGTTTVWTGTTILGGVNLVGGSCVSWTTNALLSTGGIGLVGLGLTWIDSGVPLTCDGLTLLPLLVTPPRIYCFEQ